MFLGVRGAFWGGGGGGGGGGIKFGICGDGLMGWGPWGVAWGTLVGRFSG